MTTREMNYLNAENFAKDILKKKGNRFVQNTAASDFAVDADSYKLQIGEWEAIKSYRTADSLNKTGYAECAKGLLNAGLGRGKALACMYLDIDGTSYALYGGSGDMKYSKVLSSYLPELSTNKVALNDIGYAYNGFAACEIDGNLLADKIFTAGVNNCYVMLMCIPISQQEIYDINANNREIKNYLEKYVTTQRVYGNASRRVETTDNPVIREAISVIEDEINLLGDANESFCRMVVKFGANDRENYEIVKYIVNSVRSNSNNNSRLSGIYDLGSMYSWDTILRIPRYMMGGRMVNATSMQKLGNLSEVGLIPTKTVKGITVKQYGINENSYKVFDSEITESYGNADTISLGTDDSGNAVKLITDELRGHMMVAGITNSGKSNTVKRILEQSYGKGIPFVVFESAKREYAGLIEKVPDITVYSAGSDARPLKFNPMAPVPGDFIENHVKAIVRAICAAHGEEHPLPEALEGLIKLAYEKKGWRYGTMAYVDSKKPFPNFKFTYSIIDEYIDKYANYAADVKQNLRTAIKIRINDFANGAAEYLMNSEDALTVEEILEHRVVFEMSDFSSEVSSFIVNMLLYKMQGYLSKKDESSKLKRLIVVEEAHNIFHENVDADSVSSMNNRYFEKMLAEIRSSGTGMIICDQRPSVLSSAVTANTNIKIIHNISDGSDKRILKETLGLSEFQIGRLSELGRGECIITRSGTYGHKLCKVDKISLGSGKTNLACLSCGCRFNCKKEAVKQLLNDIDFNRYNYHKSKIARDIYNTQQLIIDIDNMLNDLGVMANKSTRCCLLGQLLSENSSLSLYERRVAIASYANAVGR